MKKLIIALSAVLIGGVAEAALVNAKETLEHPEVGRIMAAGQLCSGTLVSPNAVLTAGHCFLNTTRELNETLQKMSYFEITTNDGKKHRFGLVEVKSFGPAQPGDTDIALFRLAKPVPENIAVPAKIAQGWPRKGTKVLWFGYGCDRHIKSDWMSNETDNGASVKRFSEREVGGPYTAQAANGDSGGPMMIKDTGEIYVLLSASYDGTNIPIFADVEAMRQQIEAVMKQWEKR